MTDDLLDLLCRRYTGRRAADLNWRDLLTVRDAVAHLLNGEINRRQFSDLPASRLPRGGSAAQPGVNGTGTADVATGRARTEGGERVTPSRPDPSAPSRSGAVTNGPRPPTGTPSSPLLEQSR